MQRAECSKFKRRSGWAVTVGFTFVAFCEVVTTPTTMANATNVDSKATLC